MNYIDLHAHTRHSDGTDSVRELIDKAVAKGLSAVAKTDHNTTEGNAEFLEYAKGKPIAAIPGVEISAAHAGNPVHVVGLGVGRNDRLEAVLAKIREYGRVKADYTLAQLRRSGFNITRDDVEAFAGTSNINRGTIAGYMLAKGMARDKRELFRDYLGKPEFQAPSWNMTPADAVALIHAAGGKAVWAHPLEGRGKRPAREIPFLSSILDSAGFDAIESQHSTHSAGQRAIIDAIARERGIPLSGGSDYHGASSPYIELGSGIGDNVRVPESALTDIMK